MPSCDKLFIVDLSVSLNLPDNFISTILSQVGQHVPDISGRDEAVSIFVKDTECLPYLLLAVCIIHLPIPNVPVHMTSGDHGEL